MIVFQLLIRLDEIWGRVHEWTQSKLVSGNCNEEVAFKISSSEIWRRSSTISKGDFQLVGGWKEYNTCDSSVMEVLDRNESALREANAPADFM